MADIAGNPFDSYDLTVETIIDISEVIKLLNYEDMPMIGGVNTDGMPQIGTKPTDNRIFYWQHQDMPVPRTTVGSGGVTDVATTLPVATGTGVSFAAGDAIRIEDEVLFITAVATDDLTVVRASASTTAAAHAAGADVVGLGTILDEGDIGTQQFRGRDKFSNYTQIWTSQINMTRTSQRIPHYGVPSELGNLTRQVALSEGINLEQSFLYGEKFQSGSRRSTGGLEYFLTTNRVNNAASGDWLTITEIEARQQVAYDAGGMFHTIMSRPKNFQALNNIMGSERVRTEVHDEYRGRRMATTVETEFGTVELKRNRYVRANEAFGLNFEDLRRRVMQPMVVQPLAKTDDRDKMMFVCEEGFEIQGESHMVLWTGLDNTAALPASGV